MRAFHEVRSYDGDFRVWCSTYENISFLSHWHKEVELIYVRSGGCHISVTDTDFTAQEGDLIICDTGEIHYSDSQDMANVLQFLIFEPELISSLYENSRFLHPVVTKKQLEEYGLIQKIDELFELVTKELKNKEEYYQDVVKARIREVWYLLKRHLPRGNSDMISQNRRMEQLYDFQKLLSYMDEHYADNLTLNFAAKQMNFSESHFSKVFKKMTGINYVVYLNMIRVEHAAQMLKNSGMTITDISLSCGFNNIRSFNRVFKEIVGCTPTQFCNQPDVEAYKLAHFTRKTEEKQFVENDSMTVIPNFRPTWTSE